MTTYWMEDGSFPPELSVNRRQLVDRYNRAVGAPGPSELAHEEAFIAGKVSYDDAVAFVRLAEYIIAAVDARFT